MKQLLIALLVTIGLLYSQSSVQTHAEESTMMCPAPIRYGGENSCGFGLKDSFTVNCNGEERTFTSNDCGVGVCMNDCQISQCIAAKCGCAANTNSCETTTRRVFITSNGYQGNLGGLSGADAKCQQRAQSAGLGGTWKAWLSSSTTSASSRLSHNSGQYQMVNGTVIANNWGDLTDGTIQHKIDRDEFGTYHDYRPVWTNTKSNGDRYVDIVNPETHCSNWTDTLNTNIGIVGLNVHADQRWTAFGGASCSVVFPSIGLYCFEQ